MDGIVKIEETVMEIDGEELDIMHSAEELDVKTEMTSDTDGKIERIKHENWGCDDSPIIPINFVKIEKDEPEMCVEDPVHYKDTVQLNEELNIKNHICADPKSASPDIKRIKTEHDTEKRNESDLSTANMAAKADSDASTLHTEFDFKDESHPSTWASSMRKKKTRTRQDREAVGDSLLVCYNCEFTASTKRHLIGHMKMHENRKNRYSCNYCDFRTKFRKLLTTHMAAHESNCTQFEQIYIKEENDTTRGVLHNSEDTDNAKSKLVPSSQAVAICIYCNAIFKQKRYLKDHMVRKHPEFIASDISKIHHCTVCSFKTTRSNNLQEHLLTHSETALHSNTVFKNEYSLHEDITKKRPKSKASITSKVQESTKSSLKTTLTNTKFVMEVQEGQSSASASVDNNLDCVCVVCVLLKKGFSSQNFQKKVTLSNLVDQRFLSI